MRAVRAARAALPARPTGFRRRALDGPVFPAVPALFVVTVLLEAAGFLAVFFLAEVDEPDFAVASPGV